MRSMALYVHEGLVEGIYYRFNLLKIEQEAIYFYPDNRHMWFVNRLYDEIIITFDEAH
jgi:hypothetical protein